MSQTKAVVETIKISVDRIKPSPYQPRLSFDLEDIRGSIQRDGILVPLTVRDTDGHYELIDGERRLRLAKELGYETVPCTVVSVDDDTARRMVWKVNTLRQDYTPKEKAHHFRKFQDKYGMSLRGMAAEYGIDRHTIKAYLNTFRLSKEYQQMVWDRVIPIGVIKELEVLFNSGVYPPSGILTSEEAPEIFEMLDRAAREKYFGQKEVQESVRPYLRKLREEQIEKAKTVIAEVEPDVKAPETPEELEEAAKALRREAKRRKTPKQIREEKQKKAKKTRDTIVKRLNEARELVPFDKYQKQIEDLEDTIEEDPEKALSELKNMNRRLQTAIKEAKEEEMKRKIEEEAKKRAGELEEAEKRQIEEEARKKAQEEILSTPELVKELVKRPEIRQALEEAKKVEIPPQRKGYLTLEEPLSVQYQHQREWNLKQLVGRRLNGKEFRFDFVTIGYSQKTLQDLVSLLKLVEVRFLIDVRRNPQSMYKPEFNKNRLEKDLTEIGVRYVHLPQLGIPRQARNEVYEGSITPKELLERYERVVLKTNGLSKLLEIVKGKGAFALMCTEVDPTMCHRNKIAQALIEKGMVGYDL